MTSIDSNFGHWFAGITDGEGSFGVYRSAFKLKNGELKSFYYSRYSLHLRLDDLPLLEYVKHNLGVGKISIDKGGNDYGFTENPNATYLVGNPIDLLKIIEVLDIYKLRSKKFREYEIWKECVLLKQTRRNASHPFLEYACQVLKDMKKFDSSIIDRKVNA